MYLTIKKPTFKPKIFKNLPGPIVIVFVVILVLATFSLVRDLSSSGLRPFGSIADIFAAVTGQSTLSSKTATAVVSNDYQIIDSWGRCLVNNPNAKVQVQRLADSSYANGGLDITSKGGLNQGMGFGDTGTQLDFIRAADINMSYILALTSDPTVGEAVGFVKEVNEAGKMPIIRLCFIGSNCNFKSADALAAFYQGVNEGLAGSDDEFIGVVGPNEPGTGTPSEMSGFIGDQVNYPKIIQMANDAASKLQDARVINGGHMYIAPAIFNIPNTQNNDVKEYLYNTSHVVIDPGLYDYLLGNTYNVQDGPAYKWYEESGMKKYVEDNSDLLTIITEFGYSAGGISLLKENYNLLCNDDTVDGILFFRPDYPELPVGAPRQEPPIDSKILASIINGCSKEPQKLKSKNSAWLNCNFDSCVSKDFTYSARSVAKPVTPVIKTTSTGGGTSGTPNASCNPNAFSVYSSQNVLNIAGSAARDQSKVILIGDSETQRDPYPGGVNIGQPGASSYWFLGNDPIDPSNPAKQKAKADFEASLGSNAFAAIIMLGTNDCGGVNPADFKTNLTTIAQRYDDAGIIPILSTFPDRDIGLATSKGIPSCADTTDSFNSIIRGIASAHNWPLRDGNQMVALSDLDTDGTHISNYGCLNSGTTNLLNKIRAILGGAPVNDGKDSTPTQSVNEESDPTAWLKINCSGGTCDAKQINTIQTWLPLKSLGSTTATNTAKYRSYTPSCVELASQVNSDKYDLLNQFAGKLSSGGSVYPMPWLGSLINCLSEMADYTSDFSGNTTLQSEFNPHPFSKKTTAKAETESDIARDIAQAPVNLSSVDKLYSVLKDTTVYIPDERTVCIKNNANGEETCYDNSQIDVQKLYRAYDAFSVPLNWYSLDYKTATGNVSDMVYLKNSDDLIPGPEVVVGSKSNNFSAGDLCRKYGIRKIDDETKDNYRFSGLMDCTSNDNAVYDSFQRVPGVESSRVNILCGSRIHSVDLKSEAFKNGEMALLKDPKFANCFEYHPGSNLVEFKTKDFSTAPKYNIEGAYDALYKTYLRIQTQMSQRDEKIIFQKDLGWTGTVDSIIRDGNRQVDYGDYLFKGEYDSAVCVDVNFFDNKTAKARGSSVKKTNVYYSQLGALDPMQEWIDVYTNGKNLQGETSYPNPFYDTKDLAKPNNDKKEILLPGNYYSILGALNLGQTPQLPASLALNVALPTCDQVNIAELYTKTELIGILKSMDKYKDMTSNEIQALATFMWPFETKMPKDSNVACIAKSTDYKYSDTMSAFLCKQGYSVDGVCNASNNPGEYQCVYNGGTVDKNEATCPIVTSAGGASKCLQGPGGNVTHQTLNAVDLPGDTLVAPFDGTVVQATYAYDYCKADGTAGGAVFYRGTFQGQEVTLFFYHIFVTPDLQGKTFTKGQVIARTILPTDPSVTNLGCLGSPRHSHVELANSALVPNQQGDLLSLIYATGCLQGSVSSCQLSSGSDYKCDAPVGGGGVGGGCNEWNCDSKGTFQESLMCISSLSYIKGSTDKFIDLYGPYCDNETYKSVTLPFAYNFTVFYDTYLKPGTVGGRSCAELPPSQPRDGDKGMACPAFSARYGTEPYNYYRGALMRCGIPDGQRGWTSATTFGIDDPEALAVYMINTLKVSYNGFFLGDTPKVKVVEVLRQAKANDINPFLLLGTWGTESWFGQYNKKCNIVP